MSTASTSAAILQLAPGARVPPDSDIPVAVAMSVPPQVLVSAGVGEVIAALNEPPASLVAEVG